MVIRSGTVQDMEGLDWPGRPTGSTAIKSWPRLWNRSVKSQTNHLLFAYVNKQLKSFSLAGVNLVKLAAINKVHLAGFVLTAKGLVELVVQLAGRVIRHVEQADRMKFGSGLLKLQRLFFYLLIAIESIQRS